MNKAYERINWENYPSENTALDEINLNKMDSALNEVDNRVVAHETTKLDVATANSMVRNISFNERTGIFTVTYLNGSTKELDTKLEKIATNFVYDEERQKIILTLIDGTTQEIDMSALITQYEFENSAYISFTVVNGKVKAEIINGSITADKLQPNFLADVTLQANNAKTSEQNAKTSEQNAKQSEINAKNYADSAEPVASTAQGLNPTLDNSTGAPIISFKGDGATKQQTYSGKNKLNVTATSKTQEGITFTVNPDKSVTVNGTATTRTYFKVGDIVDVEETSYILSGTPKDSSSGAPFLYASHTTEGVTDKHDFGNGVAIDNIADYGNISICVPVNVTVNNAIFYPMLRPSSIEDATYEPYVGGTASPNPKYKQEIYGAGQSRNEFDKENANIIEGYLNADSTITAGANSTTIYIPCKPNKVYTISKAVGARFAVAYTKELPSVGVTVYGYISKFTAESITIETGSDATYLVAWVHNTNVTEPMTASEMIATIQIEKGTKATPYKPYGKHSLTVKATGNNKFDIESWLTGLGIIYTKSNNTITFTSEDNPTTISKSATASMAYKVAEEDVEMTISVKSIDGLVSGNNPAFRILNASGEYVATVSNYTGTKTVKGNRISLTYSTMATSGSGIAIDSVQVELGNTATPYKPYTETKADIPLSSPLYDGDYIRLNMDGTGEVVSENVRYVYDGSSDESISLQSVNAHGIANFYIKTSVKVLDSTVRSNRFTRQITTIADTTSEGIFNNPTTLYLRIKSERASTVEELRAWLKENNVEVVCKVQEPTVTPLTAEQIAEFEKLRSFDGTTHVTCEAECEIQYFCDSVSGKAVASVVSKVENELRQVEMDMADTAIHANRALNTANSANEKATYNGSYIISYDYGTGMVMDKSTENGAVASALASMQSAIRQIAAGVTENKAKIDALSSQ